MKLTDEKILQAAARIRVREDAMRKLDTLGDATEIMIRWTSTKKGPGIFRTSESLYIPATVEMIEPMVREYFEAIIRANPTYQD